MKRLLILVAVLCWTVPALGSVDFSMSYDEGTDTLTISYNVSSGANPSGIALKLNVDGVSTSNIDADGGTGCNINAISDATGSSNFDIHLDHAWNEEQGSGYTLRTGNPLAKWIDTPGQDRGLPTLPADKVALCMGHLRDNASNTVFSGPSSDDIVTITLTGVVAGSTVVVLDVDSDRGGVVGSVLTTNLPIEFLIPSLGCTYTGPDTAEWASLGSPACWCVVDQCHGNADGLRETFGFGTVAVGSDDLSVMAGAWKNASGATSPGVCADFNHADEVFGFGRVRVGSDDLTVLGAWWKNPVVPADCQTATPVSP